MVADTKSELADLQASRIPVALRIGVTGHRELGNEKLIKDTVNTELQKLEELLIKEFPNSPHTFIAISPLAEGADRLVANEILQMSTKEKKYAPFLEVVLPMPEEIYSRDFIGLDSLESFNHLLKKAKIVKTLDYNGDRDEAFEKVGRNVVDNCDILFIIWDGNKAAGRGGTAEIYEYAKKDCSYIWISSETGIVKEKCIDYERLIRPLKMLDQFNNENLKPEKLSKLADLRYMSFLSKAPENIIHSDSMKLFREEFMPIYARSSLLSKFYHQWYFRAGAMVYILSALAVGTVTFQTLFYPENPEILWLEVLYIIGIIFTVYTSNRISLHRRWIDYRILAERMRTEVFFTIAGIRHEPLEYLPYVNHSDQTDYWLVKAFFWIWTALPQRKQDLILNVNILKDYLKTFWVEDQLKFYIKKSHEQREIHEKFELMGLELFIFTLIAAFLHASQLERFVFGHELIKPNILASIGIILPAMGASLAGILSNREFLKNSARYEQMIPPLRGICQQIDVVSNMSQLTELLEQANDLILRENQDWRVSFLYQKLSPP